MSLYSQGCSVAVKCKDGVVLGNERRASWGLTVMSKTTKKVFTLTDKIGMTCAGLIGDFQMLVRIMRAQANLYKLDNDAEITTRAMGKLVASYLYSRKYFPLFTNTSIAGVDPDGPKLYTLDAIGSLMPDDYGVGGNGAAIAVGILERDYSPDIEVAKGETLVEEAIRAAIARDATAGNGIDLLTIDASGPREIFKPVTGLGE
ncbi:MAG: archaeal proteasome endopeptidase complex subunit beta [Promethearchaeota archaeon]